MMESATVEPGLGQNLNDLQNYLVHFSKEIETATQPTSDQLQDITLIQSGIQNSSETESAAPVVELVTSKSDSGQSSQFSSGFYTEQSVIQVAASIQELSGMTHSVSVAGSHNVGNSATINTEQDQMESESKQQEESSADSLENYHDYIASLTGEKIDAEELTVEPVTLAQELAVSSMMEGLVSQTSAGKMIRIVSVGKDGQMQLVGEDMAGGINISNLELKQEPPSELDAVGGLELKQTNVIDGTDPVAVLASVASNTSSLSQIHGTVRGDINDAQMVALQNSADSSQPQLVAVHAAISESMQVINAADAITGQANQVMLNTGSSFQTVTIVPSEVNQDSGVVSYVLIVSPDGDKEGGEKTIALDMAGYDLKEDALREVSEEIIQEDGTTHRVLKITPQNFFPGTQTQLMCNICNYTSPKRYLLSRHMKTHSEDRPYKCNICERGFKTLASLTNHVNTHTGTRPHKCKDCESSFTTSGELVRHVRYRHTFEKPHKCPECDYASVELSKLKRHIRMHTGERPYQCQHCSYASPDTYKLKRHLRIHTGEKPYECDQCHARFTQSNSLKAHKLIHSGDKPIFQCDLCPTTCGRKTDLKIHYQKLHTSEHPLLCRKCGQNFPDRYTYKLHLKQHEGEKCFKCVECDYAALSQRHLESHMLVHSGEKPFECGGCDQTFRQKQLLRRHQNIHHTPDYVKPVSRVKSYSCSECDKIFAHRGYLARHLEMHGKHVTFSESEDEPDVVDLPTISAQHILESNLMQEWRDGKLGNSPQVVIVHPDGRVEEVTPKLQAPPDRTVDDLLDAMSVQTAGTQGSAEGKMQTETKSGEVQDKGVGDSINEAGLNSEYKDVGNQTVEGGKERSEDVAPEGVDPDPSAAVQLSNQESVGLVKQTQNRAGQSSVVHVTEECQMKEAGTQATIDSDSEEDTFQPTIVSYRTVNSSEKKAKLISIDKPAASNTDRHYSSELMKMRTVNPEDIRIQLGPTSLSTSDSTKCATVIPTDQFKIGSIESGSIVSSACLDQINFGTTDICPDTITAAPKTMYSLSSVKTEPGFVVSKTIASPYVDSSIGSGPLYPVNSKPLDSVLAASASVNQNKEMLQCLDPVTGELRESSISADPPCENSKPNVSVCSQSDVMTAAVSLLKQEGNITSSVTLQSPDRLTRSMKRKEIELEASPAKRTRRATADSK